MKIKDGFVVRTVMGRHIIVAEGAQQANFHKIISLNPSAALLWESVVGKDFTVQDLADVLTGHYDIDPESALADAAEMARMWEENGLVDA